MSGGGRHVDRRRSLEFQSFCCIFEERRRSGIENKPTKRAVQTALAIANSRCRRESRSSNSSLEAEPLERLPSAQTATRISHTMQCYKVRALISRGQEMVNETIDTSIQYIHSILLHGAERSADTTLSLGPTLKLTAHQGCCGLSHST